MTCTILYRVYTVVSVNIYTYMENIKEHKYIYCVRLFHLVLAVGWRARE